MTSKEAWGWQEQAGRTDAVSPCLLELRRKVAALEKDSEPKEKAPLWDLDKLRVAKKAVEEVRDRLEALEKENAAHGRNHINIQTSIDEVHKQSKEIAGLRSHFGDHQRIQIEHLKMIGKEYRQEATRLEEMLKSVSGRELAHYDEIRTEIASEIDDLDDLEKQVSQQNIERSKEYDRFTTQHKDLFGCLYNKLNDLEWRYENEIKAAVLKNIVPDSPNQMDWEQSREKKEDPPATPKRISLAWEKKKREAKIQELVEKYEKKLGWLGEAIWERLRPFEQGVIKQDPEFPHIFFGEGRTCQPEDWVEVLYPHCQLTTVERYSYFKNVGECEMTRWREGKMIRWLARPLQDEEAEKK